MKKSLVMQFHSRLVVARPRHETTCNSGPGRFAGVQWVAVPARFPDRRDQIGSALPKLGSEAASGSAVARRTDWKAVWAVECSRPMFALAIAFALLPGLTRVAAGDFQGATHLMPFEEDTIAYSKAKADSAVERLQRRLDAGQTTLPYDANRGYLPALLRELGIPVSSQMLVFSKTSLQRERISPRNPRSLFFNDEAYVGYIPGAHLLEISVADPKLGGVFYTLEQKQVLSPKFTRNDQCLECHASAKTMGVPGHLVRSFETDETGVIDFSTGASLVNHRTPLSDRWGGWYVTGTHGSQLHRGNLVGREAFAKQITEPNHLGNLTNLSRFFDPSPYPQGGSDIVALMIFEHQAHMHNFLARLTCEATISQAQYGHLNYLKAKVDSFLKYLLFTEEAPLSAPIQGSNEFAAEFARRGPKDQHGRSLRDLDLQTRLFKHPCSYLIYSDAFKQMPSNLKAQILKRLHEVLSGREAAPEFGSMPRQSKQAIFEILADTTKDLPEFEAFRGSPAGASNSKPKATVNEASR